MKIFLRLFLVTKGWICGLFFMTGVICVVQLFRMDGIPGLMHPNPEYRDLGVILPNVVPPALCLFLAGFCFIVAAFHLVEFVMNYRGFVGWICAQSQKDIDKTIDRGFYESFCKFLLSKVNNREQQAGKQLLEDIRDSMKPNTEKSIKSLLDDITPLNTHDEFDWGVEQGNEFKFGKMNNCSNKTKDQDKKQEQTPPASSIIRR